MNRQEVDKICMDVNFGKVREVEHTITHQHGRILSCHDGYMEVQTGNRLQRWAGSNCEKS